MKKGNILKVSVDNIEKAGFMSYIHNNEALDMSGKLEYEKIASFFDELGYMTESKRKALEIGIGLK